MKLEESDVSVRLSDPGLWNKFHSCKTEMVVTKSGRKMFPKLEYLISGMEPETYYGLLLQIERVDDNRYKFQAGDWVPAGRAESAVSVKSVFHHDGIMQGSSWMRAPINFERVKITNNHTDTSPSNIYLQSMHRYVPVLTVFKVSAGQGSIPILPVSSEPPSAVARIKLECTEFIAVTAYQNQNITQLKIEHNPFAKGFRDGGASSGERKRNGSSPLSTPSPKRSPPLGMVPMGAFGMMGSPLGQMNLAPPQPPNFMRMPNLPFYNPLMFNSLMFNPAVLAAQYSFSLPPSYKQG